MSREKFEMAQEDEKKAADYREEIRRVEGAGAEFGEPEGEEGVRRMIMDPSYLYARIKHELAKKKVEGLKNIDHEKALELNEEYESLKRKVNESLEALETFEKEQLGMNVKEG